MRHLTTLAISSLAVLVLTGCASMSEGGGARACDLQLRSRSVFNARLQAAGYRLEGGQSLEEARNLVGKTILESYWQDYRQCATRKAQNTAGVFLSVDQEVAKALDTIADISLNTAVDAQARVNLLTRARDAHLASIAGFSATKRTDPESPDVVESYLPPAPPLVTTQLEALLARGDDEVSARLRQRISEAVTADLLIGAGNTRNSISLFLSGALDSRQMLSATLNGIYRAGRDVVRHGNAAPAQAGVRQ